MKKKKRGRIRKEEGGGVEKEEEMFTRKYSMSRVDPTNKEIILLESTIYTIECERDNRGKYSILNVESP